MLNLEKGVIVSFKFGFVKGFEEYFSGWHNKNLEVRNIIANKGFLQKIVEHKSGTDEYSIFVLKRRFSFLRKVNWLIG